MGRRSSSFTLPLEPRLPGQPAVAWLCTALRTEILEGRLRPGSRLPPSRDLARQHGVSRGTIVAAFEQLAAEGYVGGSIGSGTYVNGTLPDSLLQVRSPNSKAPSPGPSRRHLSGYGRAVRLFGGTMPRPTRAFRANIPALDLFPATLWAQVAGRRLRRMSTQLLIGTGSTGYRPLQEAIAEYLRSSRGVNAEPEQVMILSGVQEAIDLVGRLWLDRGDRVSVENPGYTGATMVFDALGARVIGLPVDEEGMVVPPRRLKHVRLAYVTPGHQFPLGIGMTIARRLALIEWARETGAVILEDDYDSEYRYSGRPLPAMQGLDRHGVVLFAGSFSKVLFPSLRMGYLVVPPDLIDRFEAALSITIRHAPLLDQAVLADFIAEGHFARHVRRMREVYAERLGVLLAAARERLDGLLEISGVEAGLQTVGWLAPGLASVPAAESAGRRGVEVTPLGEYTRGTVAREGLQLGFAAVDTMELKRGVEQLAVALEELGGAR